MEILMLEMPAWQVFTAIGIILCVGEIFIPGFVVLPIGVGFLVTAPIAYWSDSIVVQMLTLAAAEIVVFLTLRKMNPGLTKPVIYSNAEGMVGQECEVVEEVSAARPGYIKLYGDRWQAKTHSTKKFNPGDRVVITRIDGNKVFVEEMNSTGEES